MNDRIIIQYLDRDTQQLTFTEAARRMGGEVVGLREDFVIRGVTTLEESRPGWVSFISNPRFLDLARTSQASGFLVTAKSVVPDRPCIVLDNVWKGMLVLLNHFHPAPPPEPYVHPTAILGSNVSLGTDVWIGPYVVIENDATIGSRSRIHAHCYIGRGVRIGEDVLFHPRVTILHNCEVGNRVILHPGVVIGADGFKYEFIDGRLTKIPQVGRVVIEDDVELGAQTCVDRASLTETRICRGVKIDNLCQIAHNVRVGAGTVFAAQVGVAGSTRIGENCFLAGQVGLVDNIEVGDRAKLGAQAGVKNNVPPDVYYLGAPAIPAKQFMRIQADLNHLGEMRMKIKEFEQRIARLEPKQPDESKKQECG
ncbi:MAG: UDP-3-O-(3-hydroxymyristoyl)glucosamine N-acyltransferase [Candidatus Sumerlaeia bacterium]|nr:UDP-3-O-(3-hydroxymyristoyl)glucosamine N-acyltransferase [Candidatus Sumerlaeia bacterium]